MNKKPIRRNENILKLSKEHHFSLLFCWKIRQGLKMNIEPNRITDYVEYFKSGFLDPHFREEEDFLFALVDDSRVDKAIDQHKQINGLIDELAKNTQNHSYEKLEKLANLVDDHVRFEERQLFPFMEKTLTNEQLDEVGKNLDEDESLPLKDEYTDEFWVKR